MRSGRLGIRSGAGPIQLAQDDGCSWRMSMRGGKHAAWRDIRFHSPTLPIGPHVREQPTISSSVFVHIVDDADAVRESLGDLLRSMGYQVTLHGSASAFLKVELPDTPACLVLDVRLPGTNGLELQ